MIKTLLLFIVVTSSVIATGFGSASNESTKPIKKKGSDGKEYQYLICTSLSSGYYYKAGEKLSSLLGMNIEDNTPYARAETTDGTKQNYNLMSDGVCNVIFIQGDYLAYIKAKDKDFFKGKAIIELERTEQVQLIMRKGEDEDDLQSKNNSKILVGLVNSGASASWNVIQNLEDGYKKVKIVYGDLDLSSLTDLNKGDIDAILRTSHFNLNDQFSKDVKHNKKINFVDFDDSDLNDEINFGEGSKRIYEFVNIPLENGFFSKKVTMLELKTYIIVDKKDMTKKQKNKILRVITENKSQLFN